MRSWKDSQESVCKLFVDAASTPAYCAAVLFIDGVTWYTASGPSEAIMEQLAVRHDNQITSLVILCLSSDAWFENLNFEPVEIADMVI